MFLRLTNRLNSTPGEQRRDTVLRFTSTEPSDSYSMQTFHDSSAMGVIAVAAFREKQPVRILRERAKKEQMPGSPGPARKHEQKPF